MSLEHPTCTEQEVAGVPIVSVVIPTRGRADLLEQCVASMLTQTISRIEVIVVVDGPDPATIELLTSLDDDRLTHLVHPQSRGVSHARNSGIARATGRWLAFCDDDDVWAPTKLAAQLQVLGEQPAARWAIAGEVRIHQDSGSSSYPVPPTAEVVAAELPHSNVIPAGCSGVIADRQLVIELGGFDPRLSTLADRDLWIRLNRASPVAVAAQPLVGYRDHGGAMTRRLRNLEDELDVIRDKYSDELASSSRHFPSDGFYVWTYRRTFRAGDWRGGLDLLVRSSRFRTVVAQWVWARVKDRCGAVTQDVGVSVPVLADRSASVAKFPWLGIMFPEATGAHVDALADHRGGGTSRTEAIRQTAR
jgi:glycosyltransferase involved in cell wall biosynthesis